MNYEETLDYLFTRLPVFQRTGASAYKEGLDNSLALDNYLNHPHRNYRTIHVAGTNGKGSTSHLLAAVLQKAGYKTGLYTSPHLVDFRERIRVNGEMMDKESVVNFVENCREFSETIQPSFFELTMMMAFHYFSVQQVDVAIIEVGLGGRLDSTNIITPELSIITNISLDHVQFLGDTLPKIAAEKAGIMKANIPVVIGEAEGEVKEVFDRSAKANHAPIIYVEQNRPIHRATQLTNGGWSFETNHFGEIYGELGGLCQDKNAATVFTAIEQLRQLEFNISDEAIKFAFANVCQSTGLQGRWQTVSKSPRIICDTGHNEAGLKYIVQQLQNLQFDRLHFVLGMVNDKDVSKIVTLLPKEATYYFTKAAIPRALSEMEMKLQGEKCGLIGNSFPSVSKAIEAALNQVKENDLLFIGGSTFIVADALLYFRNKNSVI